MKINVLEKIIVLWIILLFLCSCGVKTSLPVENSLLSSGKSETCRMIEFENIVSKKYIINHDNQNCNMLFAEFIREYGISIPDSSFEFQMFYSSNQPYDLSCYDTAIRIVQMPFFTPSKMLLLNTSNEMGKYCTECTHILMDGSYPGGGRPTFNLKYCDTTLSLKNLIGLIQQKDFWNDTTTIYSDNETKVHDGTIYKIEIKIGSKMKVISFYTGTKYAKMFKPEINYSDSVSSNVRRIGLQRLNQFN